MKSIILPDTELKLSKFIFGTGSLLKSGNKRYRTNLLHAAVSNGFTHFDTAPYYGFGQAERDLSTILKQNPEISVTSKVGLYSPGGENQSELSIISRKLMGKFLPKFSAPIINLQIKQAKKSLEGSLNRLQRGTIDLFLLHDPILEMLNIDEWRLWLEQSVKEGKIRYFGLALNEALVTPFLRQGVNLGTVIQLQDSIEKNEAKILSEYGKKVQVTYGYHSSTITNSNSHMPPETILQQALIKNKDGAIVVSTTKLNRVQQYQKIARP